jgi:FlaA1/EpsC-like NDP-sugar epimerase
MIGFSEARWRSSLLSRGAQMGIDLTAMLLAYLLAVALRFDFRLNDILPNLTWDVFALVLGGQMLFMHLFGCYRLIWRFISIGDLPRLFYAVIGPAAVFMAIRLFLPDYPYCPRIPGSVIILNAGFCFAGICGVRLARRALKEQESSRVHGAVATEDGDLSKPAPRVLLVGAGSSGVAVLKDLHLHGGNMQILGFLDDDPEKRNAIIQGVRVIGRLEDLSDLILELAIDQVIVTMVSVPREVLRKVTRTCEENHVPVRIIPGYFEIAAGKVSTNRIRDVDIEDLLGREAVALNEPELARFVNGKCVLITGAGGSIGSELARQVARLGPSRLLLLERAENAMYEIHREIRALRGDLDLLALVADVGDEPRLARIFAQHRPQVIIHAAAHKHVPMMEMNPCEAIKNNTLATRRMGELAVAAGVECLVQISTDKAVNPTSVMGASKRLAELALQDLNRLGKTRFVAVRFGNVLGSAGSVVPLFHEQIRKGGPVTVTHPDMVRYFMTIPEAVGLVLQAAAMAGGGEIFILDMGAPVKIVDLAEDMIRLSGFKPHDEIQIVFTGIRPGEKLFEELGTSADQALKTRHPRVLIGKIPTLASQEVSVMLEMFRELCQREAVGEEIRAAISKAIPEAMLK